MMNNRWQLFFISIRFYRKGIKGISCRGFDPNERKKTITRRVINQETKKARHNDLRGSPKQVIGCIHGPHQAHQLYYVQNEELSMDNIGC